MTSNLEKAAEIVYNYGQTTFEKSLFTARALSAEGVIAPDLPEPTWEHSTTWNVPGEYEWQTDTYKGEVMLEVDVEEPGHFAPLTTSKLWVMKRDEARALALALLAAVARAQKEEASE